MAALFWLSVLGLIYTYAGFPLLIAALARWYPKKALQNPSFELPSVTVILVVHNEENLVVSRLKNLLDQDYPDLDIVVVSDGATDGTERAVLGMAGERIKLIARSERSGKAACLSAAVPEAKGELLVFTDVRQKFRPDTISRLVQWFSNPNVGAVSGALEIEPSSHEIGKGIGSYWDLEKRLRYGEALYDSSIGCTGAVYAIRKQAFRPLPEDTLLDDVVIPMRVALQGYRVLFDPSAIAYDPQALDPDRERIRKRRTLAGNFQLLFRYPEWMLPWKNRLWWQLISHKYARLASPFLLGTAFISTVFLRSHWVYELFLAAQIAFYAAALLGRIGIFKKHRLLALPASFVFLNGMILLGLTHYLRGGHGGAWERTASPQNQGPPQN